MKFMIAYYGGDAPASKEEGMEHMKKWKSWVESLGDKVISPGTPFPQSFLITESSVEKDTRADAMKALQLLKHLTLKKQLKLRNRIHFFKQREQ